MTQLTIRSKEKAPWESVLRCREQAGTIFRIEEKLCLMKAWSVLRLLEAASTR